MPNRNHRQIRKSILQNALHPNANFDSFALISLFRDAAERQLLHIVAQVADEASDLRHLLFHATSPQSASHHPSTQEGLLGDGPETPIPEPAGMALSTLAVTARKTVVALREVREREGRLGEELEGARQKVEHVER